MGMKLVERLDARAAKLVGFREALEGASVPLERAEAAHRAFFRMRSKLVDSAPALSELRGLVAGLTRAGQLLRARQDAVRAEVEAERLDAVAGKAATAELATLAKALTADAAAKQAEVTRLAGTLDGYFWAAGDCLEEVARVLEHAARAKRVAEDEEEDWSGRGTPNGQRARKTRAKKARGKKRAVGKEETSE